MFKNLHIYKINFLEQKQAQDVLKKIEPVNNNLTELLNDIGVRPTRFVYRNVSILKKAIYIYILVRNKKEKKLFYKI